MVAISGDAIAKDPVSVQIYHLMYHSQSALDGTGGTPFGELGRLLEECLNANPARAVTGVLAFHDDRFLQVLEGPEAAIDRLYGAILRDRRHDRVELLLRAPCDCRQFAKWSMAFTYRNPQLLPVFGHIVARHTRAQALSIVATLAEIVS